MSEMPAPGSPTPSSSAAARPEVPASKAADTRSGEGTVAAVATVPDTGLGHPLAAAADPVDRVVRLAPKWTLFALAGCALLVVGAVIWAFFGEVTGVVNAPGILKDNGYLGLSAGQPGRVSAINVASGDSVAKGENLVELEGGAKVSAPTDGLVSAVYVAVGTEVTANTVVAALTDADQADVVYTLLPSVSVGQVDAGMPVQMEVGSAPASTYGYLLGTLQEVSSEPLTTSQIASTLGLDPQLVVQALGSQPGLLAVVGVTSEPDNPSNYAWTVGSGPPFLLTQGSQVSVQVIVSRQRPIDVVFPNSDGGQAAAAAAPAARVPR